MSILIGRKKIPISISTNVKCSAVNMERKETLAEYVKRVRAEKGLSLTDVQKRSGNQIANSYVSRIENGIADAQGVTPKKLQALARGLGVSEDEIFAIARGRSLDKSDAVDAEMALFASRIKKLTAQQKRDFQIAWRMANELLDRLEREKGEQAQGEDRR